MKELINFAFDFFGHILPGFWIVCSTTLLLFNLDSINAIRDFILILDVNGIILITIISYIIGFAIDPIGKYMYKCLGRKLWGIKSESNNDLTISEKFVLIREYSPNNFKYIETWHMYCSMSYNFSTASLLMFIACISSLFNYPSNWLFWTISSLGSVILFFLFLYRAVLFSSWAVLDLNAAINKLKLEEQNLLINKTKQLL